MFNAHTLSWEEITMKQIHEGNVVEEYMLGNTKIKICDNAYIGKTQKDIDKILANIARIVRDGYLKNS